MSGSAAAFRISQAQDKCGLRFLSGRERIESARGVDKGRARIDADRDTKRFGDLPWSRRAARFCGVHASIAA
jgi:hypothetical protein